MYGMLSSVMNYVTGAMITISESGKCYFSNKENAYKRAEEQQKKDENAIKTNSLSSFSVHSLPKKFLEITIIANSEFDVPSKITCFQLSPHDNTSVS